jgi:hypothetical protein
MPGPRNPIALNPLLGKGGAHTQTRAALRQDNRRQLDEAIDEWLENSGREDDSTSSVERTQKNRAAGKAPAR